MTSISAVIPVRNTDPAELRRALTSLRATKIVSEIILVDDHSDPEFQPQIQAWAERGCKVIMSRRYRNTPSARATGVHAARGDYILNMDSDDLIHNEGVRKDELAPINLASSNIQEKLAINIFDFIDHPMPCQWGSIVRRDISLSLAKETDNRHEDMFWAQRLFMLAWRDALRVSYPSGVRYWWRSEIGRNSQTSRHGRDSAKLATIMQEQLKISAQHLDVPLDIFEAWIHRKSQSPITHCVGKQQRVDTHVLSYLGNIGWLRQCLASLDTEPTNIQLVMGGFPNSIGQARAYAFTLGTSEYVSFLDDDDYALPGAMQQCVDYLDANPDCVGVYTNRYHLHANGRMDPEYLRPWHWRRMYHRISEVTHLKVMRRSAVIPYLEELKRWPTWEEYVLCGLMTAHGRWHHLPIFGAVKRYKHPSESSLRLSSGRLMQQARARVLPVMSSGGAR